MSSIAYVTDNTMIEFHRLNGNNKINFWKPSNSIHFADFKHGDLLFFLAKGTERNKEKGIIGYGSFENGARMSPNQAWNRFGTLNGYHSKEEFFQAILRAGKKSIMPKSIGCLFLQDVVYFQEPLYLSELGVYLSNRIQSYTYLEKDNEDIVHLILRKAKEIGVDMWSLSVNLNSSDESVIEQDQIKEYVAKAHDTIGTSFYSEPQQRKLRKFMSSFLSEQSLDKNPYEFIKGSPIDCYRYVNKTLFIVTPLMSFTKDVSTYVQFVMGRLFAYQSYLESTIAANIKIHMHIAVAQPLDDAMASLLIQRGISIYGNQSEA